MSGSSDGIESPCYLYARARGRKGAAVKLLSLEPLLGPLGVLDLSDIDRVIVGGESGPQARPVEAAWGREIRKQCCREGVSFFFKQWGGTHKKENGCSLDRRTWDGMPKNHLVRLEAR